MTQKGNNKMKVSNAILRSFLFTCFVLIMASCGKDVNQFIPGEPKGNIGDFFTKVQTNEDTVTIDNTVDNDIITDNNTIISIPADAFIDENGTPVTGSVEFKYIEIFDKASMMLYDVPTNSNGELLDSDGVYKFSAFQDGKALSLNANSSIRVRINNENFDTEMKLFYGVRENERFDWKPAVADPQEWDFIPIGEWDLSGKVGFGYDVVLDQLGWMNVDKFYDIPEDQKTSVCVELPQIYTNTNTTVFMIFNDYDSAVGMYGDIDNKQFCEAYELTPIGFDVTFVAISEQGDGVYHFGMKNAVIQENHYNFIIMEEKSLDEILDIISIF